MFGLDSRQTDEAYSILKVIALQWRELVAGSEGFLTGKNRRGLYRQAVVWGEMVNGIFFSITNKNLSQVDVRPALSPC